jgi:hypothetical protein
MISSVPDSNGIAAPVVLTTAALLVAFAEDTPTPINTVTVPEFKTRYWFPPRVEEDACTGVGAEVVALNTTVFPQGLKALIPMISPIKNTVCFCGECT